MKKVVSLIIVAALAFCTFASCNSKSENTTPDADLTEDLYSEIEEAPVSEYTPEEIKSIYSVMCDKLGGATSSYGDTSEKAVLLASDDLDSKSDDKIFDPADYVTTVPSEIVSRFYILKEFAEHGFEQFCNAYAILGKDTLIRIRINDTLQELELSVKTGNTYLFYANYYLNDKGQKHLEYREGDTLCVEYHNITYTVQNNKVAFPITYFRFGLIGSQHYTLNNQDDLEELDITELYDTLKYPFIKHIDSQLIQSLLNSSSATIIGEKKFRNAVDKTLYNFNYVGEFNIEGLNFSGDDLPATVVDNKLVFASDKFHIKAAVPAIYFRKNGGLYAKVTFSTIDREATSDGIKTVVERIENDYLISKGVRRTEDGVEFDLEKEIDLSKPARSTPSRSEYVEGSPNDTFIAHEENIYATDLGNALLSYAFMTSKNELFFTTAIYG